jgi:Domain of unknown function (DUF4304)
MQLDKLELAGCPVTTNPHEIAAAMLDAELKALFSAGTTKLAKPKIAHAWKTNLVPVISALGFSGIGCDFSRKTERSIQTISLQKFNGGGSFSVNFGMQPLILARNDQTTCRERNCVIRTRWSTDGLDIWWRYENSIESMVAAAQSAARLMDKNCDVQFDWLETAVFDATEPDWDSVDPISRSGIVLARNLVRSNGNSPAIQNND